MQMLKRLPIVLIAASILWIATSTQAEDQPRTPPEQGRGAMLERLEKNLNEVGLNETQQEKVDRILSNAAEKLTQLRENSAGDLKTLRDQAGEVFRTTHAELNQVLTASQQEKLQSLMPRAGQDQQRSEDKKTEPKADDKPAKVKKSDKKKQDSEKVADKESAGDMEMSSKPPADMMADEKKPDPKPQTPETAKPKPAHPTDLVPSLAAVPESLAPGANAPNFNLKNLNGKSVSLQSQRGKPTVLIFGSFTSPTFRDKIASFDALNKDYRNKVNVILIYTREAYPNNEWDVQRNIDDQIRIAQHTTIEERTNMAKVTRDGLKIGLDILVDEMDDAATDAYAGTPNGCIVIDSAGKVVLRQRWADAHGVRAALDETLRAR